MSYADKEKWEQRYHAGAYQERTQPSVFLTECLPRIQQAQQSRIENPAVLRALDIACGAGRNALYLARQGYQVDAVDISTEALRRGRMSAEQAGLSGITWIEQDLEQGLPAGCDSYDLIIMLRYLDLSLLQSATALLREGGYLLAEVHLRSDEAVVGPSGTRFRAAAGELKAVADALSISIYREEITQDPDGNKVALARLLARNEPVTSPTR
ncbi:MAG: methyltransferase domain-containing protein [Pseudomonadales bacterium]|nr:methyltransferase domain-containing protein [Pseudomonadales bacterium]